MEVGNDRVGKGTLGNINGRPTIWPTDLTSACPEQPSGYPFCVSSTPLLCVCSLLVLLSVSWL